VMEGVPLNLKLPEVGQSMAGVDGVRAVHDLHIWTLGSGRVALSAHIVLDRMEQWPALLPTLQALLAKRYRIDHTPLQPEPPTVAVIHPMPYPGDTDEHDHDH